MGCGISNSLLRFLFLSRSLRLLTQLSKYSQCFSTSSSNLLPQIHLFPQETYNCSTETLKGGNNIISVSKFLKLNHYIRRDRLVKTNMVITGENKIWIQFCFPVNTLDHLDIHKHFLFPSNMNFSGILQPLCFNIIKE